MAVVVLVYYDSFELKWHRNWVHDTEMEEMESAQEHEQAKKATSAKQAWWTPWFVSSTLLVLPMAMCSILPKPHLIS